MTGIRARPFGRVYVLYHPVTGEVRYVGQTVQPLRKRLHGHKYDARKSASTSRLTQWVRSLLSQGLEPSICPWANASSREELDALEVHWIAEFRNRDFRLTNHASGGSSDKPSRPDGVSEETRKKLSMANKGQVRDAAARARISNGLRGRAYSQETREKLRVAGTGRRASLESRLRMSAARVGQTPEQFVQTISEIRETLLTEGLSQSAIAEMFGVTQSFVSRISAGKAWPENELALYEPRPRND